MGKLSKSDIQTLIDAGIIDAAGVEQMKEKGFVGTGRTASARRVIEGTDVVPSFYFKGRTFTMVDKTDEDGKVIGEVKKFDELPESAIELKEAILKLIEDYTVPVEPDTTDSEDDLEDDDED